MDAIDLAKRAAAEAALAELPASGVIGLGTGSTTSFFLEALGARVKAGAAYVGIPTSEASRAHALRLGIRLLDDDGPWSIDVTVDGADEVSAGLDLVKGGGGAHAREKIVNAASRRNVIVVDGTKLSTRLGEKRALPVEILRFGYRETLRRLEAFGRPALRERPSDAGNPLVDLATGPIADPAELDRALQIVPGVVETGLFVARADVVLVASVSASGKPSVRRLTRP